DLVRLEAVEGLVRGVEPLRDGIRLQELRQPLAGAVEFPDSIFGRAHGPFPLRHARHRAESATGRNVLMMPRRPTGPPAPATPRSGARWHTPRGSPSSRSLPPRPSRGNPPPTRPGASRARRAAGALPALRKLRRAPNETLPA